MTMKNLIAKHKIDDQTNKNREQLAYKLFDVRPTLTSHRKSQDVVTRQTNWTDHLKKLGIVEKNFWFEGDPENKDTLCLCFGNGLRIEDYDTNGVAFLAEDKARLDEASATNIIRIAANHLYRRGDFVLEGRNNDLNGSNYPGSAPYVEAFKKAYIEARKQASSEMARNASLERK